MNYAAIYNELVNDPEEIGYSGTTDADAAVLLHAAWGDPILTPTMLTERTLLSVFTPARGEAVLQGLAAIGASDNVAAPVVARALSWMKPSEQGIDISLPSVRGLIDTLATIPTGEETTFLTSEEDAAIKALAESHNSRAIAIGCPTATWYDIHIARKRSA